jgi:hypothetical protein
LKLAEHLRQPSAPLGGGALYSVVRKYAVLALGHSFPMFIQWLRYEYTCSGCGTLTTGPKPEGVDPPPVLHRFGGILCVAIVVAMICGLLHAVG